MVRRRSRHQPLRRALAFFSVGSHCPRRQRTAIRSDHRPCDDFRTDANRGGVWAGTDQGALLHWNEQEWVYVTTVDSPVRALLVVDGQLWVGADAGLSLLDDEDLQVVPPLGAVPIAALAVDGDSIWAGTPQGLWRLRRDGQTPEYTPLYDGDNPLDGAVQALWADGQGSLWVGIDGNAVRYRPGQRRTPVFEFSTRQSNRPPVTAIRKDLNGSVWISTAGGGVVQYMFENDVQISSRTLGSATGGGLSSNSVRAMALDGDGSLWFATPVGVARFQGWAWLDLDPLVEGLVVNDLLFDRQGHLWIATEGEGVQVRKGLYSDSEGWLPNDAMLPSDYVYDLEEDAAGAIWAATDAGVELLGNGAVSTH